MSVYARALEEGESFAAKYDALLQDTGRLMVEDLAKKHLGEDMTTVEFWQKQSTWLWQTSTSSCA